MQWNRGQVWERQGAIQRWQVEAQDLLCRPEAPKRRIQSLTHRSELRAVCIDCQASEQRCVGKEESLATVSRASIDEALSHNWLSGGSGISQAGLSPGLRTCVSTKVLT